MAAHDCFLLNKRTHWVWHLCTAWFQSSQQSHGALSYSPQRTGGSGTGYCSCLKRAGRRVKTLNRKHQQDVPRRSGHVYLLMGVWTWSKLWGQPAGGSYGGAPRKESQSGTRGPCPAPDTPGLHCKAWKRKWEPGRTCRNKGCWLHRLKPRESDFRSEQAEKVMERGLLRSFVWKHEESESKPLKYLWGSAALHPSTPGRARCLRTIRAARWRWYQLSQEPSTPACHMTPPSPGRPTPQSASSPI